MKTQTAVRLSLVATLSLLAGCGGSRDGTGAAPRPQVVVYSSQDRVFAEPILKAYAKLSSVEVLPKFDVESTKTVGLANDIIAEKSRPRCDLFWNNEILNTLRLKEQGLLAPFQPSHAGDLAETFKAKDGTWYGFAGRARVLIVNTKLIPEADRPKGIKRPARPEVEGEDRDRQAALRHHGHARRMPVRRLGRREGQGILSRPQGQRGPGPLGEQAGCHGRRIGPDRLRPNRHR